MVGNIYKNNLDSDEVIEAEIRKVSKKLRGNLKHDQVINEDCIPGNLEGVSSHFLVTATGRIAKALRIVIPNSCYILHSKKDHKQLSVKEATQKLIKFALDKRKNDLKKYCGAFSISPGYF